jgi:hypothetical protein
LHFGGKNLINETNDHPILNISTRYPIKDGKQPKEKTKASNKQKKTLCKGDSWLKNDNQTITKKT